MNWSHSTLGQFDIADQWIGLDYRRLFLDPVRAEVTLIHELTHAIISKTTDMGQATQNIFFFAKWFQHLNQAQTIELQSVLVSSQKFPQEGFATFMEMQQLRTKTSWEVALAYKADMHPEYLERFEKMEFMYRQSRKIREHFTKKICTLAMENGFRRNAPIQDLLQSPEVLSAYLSEPDNNPALRLEKILACLRANPRLVREKTRKIAKACGLKFTEPATPQEVRKYVNYLLRLCGEPEDYTVDMIGKTKGTEAASETLENLLVTNINFNLEETAESLMRTEDINYEASYAKAAFIIHYPKAEDKKLEAHIGRKLELTLLMFDRDGTKYLTVTSREHIDMLLANQLKDATIITKWGISDAATSTFDVSKVRNPDIIQYNRPADMLTTFQSTEGIRKYEWIHLGTSQDHPFQSLLVRVNGNQALHFVNGFGNAGINKVIDYMKSKRGKEMKVNDLLPYSRVINDMMAVMGLPWDIDWVGTMINQKDIIRR